MRPCTHRDKSFFACDICVPVRAEREGGTAARLVGTVGAPSVRDADCPHGRSHGPVRVSVEPLVAGDQKGQSFCIALPFQALRGLPCLGSFSVAQHIRHMARRPWLGPYSVDWRIRHLKRHPGWVLLWSSVYQEFDGTASAANAGVWGQRGYGEGSIPYVWLSSISLLPWLPGFPPQAFPTTVSSFTSPRLSLRSQQQPSPWDCATIPKLQLPASVPSGGPESLSGVCMAVTRTVWFSFHLGCYRSAVSLSALNVSPLTQTVAPM